MGNRTRDFANESILSTSPTDALLFSTMCIVGLPVDVQVTDGSVYSGVLHTACFDKDYGIVLKKAKMTRKGEKEANLGKGSIVDTLVILSTDLVQIVAKGLLLPAEGIVGKVSGKDVEAVNGSVRSLECSTESEVKTVKSSKVSLATCELKTKEISETRRSSQNECKSTCGLINKNVKNDLSSNNENGSHTVDGIYSSEAKIDKASTMSITTVDEEQVGEEKSHEKSKESETLKNSVHKDQRLSTADSSPSLVRYDNGIHVDKSSKTSSNGASCASHVPLPIKPNEQDMEKSTSADILSFEAPALDVSNSCSAVVNMSSRSCASPSVSPTGSLALKNSVSNSGVKEFKLNPGAKTFFPVLSAPRSATPPATTTTVVSMPYVQSSAPLIPVAVAQPEIGISPFTPRPSLPIKFIPYNTLVALNGDNGPQYSQPIVGRGGSMPPPVRYAGQYNPVQAGPTFVHPNSQPVMVGRLGQLVYMHPVSNDAIPGSAPPSQVSACPLLTSQVPLLKQQGTTANQAVPVCMTHPNFVTGVQQPFAVASQIPFSQPPFSAVRPIAVPTTNGPFSSKFI